MVFLMKTLVFEHRARPFKGLSTLNNHKINFMKFLYRGAGAIIDCMCIIVI